MRDVPSIDDFDAEAPEPEAGAGFYKGGACGCDSNSGPLSTTWLLAAVATLLLRRRRDGE